MGKTNIYCDENQFKHYLDNMEDVDIKNYIQERVIRQLKWYENKSNRNQFWYRVLMVISIIMSSSIPVLTLMLDLSYTIKIIISVLSSSITGISAIIALYNYRELWVQYRTSCEILKSVLYKFFTRSGEFKDLEDSKMYDMLITSCENYITKEFETWGSIKITQLKLENKASNTNKPLQQ